MSDSGLAKSPAITSLTTDFVDQMLNGSDRRNEAAAGAVAGLYFLFLCLSVFNFIRDRKCLQFLLIFFCCIRIVAFSVRAYMQKHLTENLAIVYEVFFAVGFVFLVKLLIQLLAAWTMPLYTAPKKPGMFISLGLLRNQGIGVERILTISLMIGAIVSIIGATDAYSEDADVTQYNKGLKLMKAGYTIYLVCISVFCLMVLTGPLLNRMAFGPPRSIKSATFLVSSLLVAGLLLLCKSVFQVIAIYANPALTFRNKLFYPLEVLPELLVLLIVCWPGYISYMLKGSHAYPETDSKNRIRTAKAGAETPGTTTPVGAHSTATNLPSGGLPPVTHEVPTGMNDTGVDRV